MGWSSRSGRARTSLTNPDSFAVSDRDGSWRNHSDMAFQYQWAGSELVNLKLLVGRDELDVPNEQLRTPILPPDPIPTKNPRLEPFNYDANPSQITQWDQPGGQYDSPVNEWGQPINSWDNKILGVSEVPD